MEIARKIYYERSTGNVILDTGERSGDVVETTETQDFTDFVALQPYQQSAVGVLQLAYVQDTANFGKYPYHIDITQTPPPVIAWDTANPIGGTLADVQAAKIAQLTDQYNQTLAAGFTSAANGTTTTYTYRLVPDQLNYNKIATNVLLGKQTYPFNLTDAFGVGQSFATQAQYEQFATDAGTFDWKQADQLDSLIANVKAATTNAAVDSIQWSAGTY